MPSCLAAFGKVLLGLGFCSDNFCLIDCVSLKRCVSGLDMSGR